MKKLLYLLFLIVGSVQAQDDIIVLVNGKKFEGNIKKIEYGHVSFKVRHKDSKVVNYDIPIDSVEAIYYHGLKSMLKRTDSLQSSEDQDAYIKGYKDAAKYHGHKGTYFFSGFFFGLLGVGASYIDKPTPLKGRGKWMMLKEIELFDDPDYLRGYKKSVRKNQVHSVAGWMTSLFVIVILL